MPLLLDTKPDGELNIRMSPQCHTLSDDKLEAYLLGHLPSDQRTAIVEHCRTCLDCRSQLFELEGFILNLRVALSRVEAEVATATALGIPDVEEAGTRDVPRLPCDIAVSVSYLDDGGTVCRVRGKLVDRSVEGAALLVPEPMPIDVPIAIAAKNRKLEATVRYCQVTDGGFRVGVKIAGHNGQRGW